MNFIVGLPSASCSTTWAPSLTTYTRVRHRQSWWARKARPEAYYFPPQYNPVDNNFPLTYFGLDLSTTKAQIRRSLERWNEGHNGILELLRADRLRRHRLAGAALYPACSRLALYIRAAATSSLHANPCSMVVRCP